MNKIKREGSVFAVKHFPWKKYNPATPRTEVTLGYDDGGFTVHFVSYESNLRAVQTQHNTLVCQDSCMEIFMQFAPASDPRYINIEINPNGAAYCAVNFCRESSELIPPNEIDGLDIKTAVFDDRWEIDYYIPAEWISRLIPDYRHERGATVRGNFYKCGDLTDHEHYGCFHPIEWAHPDFHRPEFFAEFVLI